jgi:hypothetical protein
MYVVVSLWGLAWLHDMFLFWRYFLPGDDAIFVLDKIYLYISLDYIFELFVPRRYTVHVK